MVLKIFGAFTVIIGSFLYGQALCRQIKDNVRFLMEYKEALFVINGHIRYGRSNMPQLLTDVTHNIKNPELKGFFAEVSKLLIDNTFKNFNEVWDKCVDTCLTVPYMENERELIKETGLLPVYMDAVMQQEFLEEKILCVQKRIDELNDNSKEKFKVYKSVCLFVGIMLVLILF